MYDTISLSTDAIILEASEQKLHVFRKAAEISAGRDYLFWESTALQGEEGEEIERGCVCVFVHSSTFFSCRLTDWEIFQWKTDHFFFTKS